ncbi:GNAT family N-acetyltransferase [Rhodoluna limnophila]|uniref:GNAT family N-acetyltransferase n=1 Tax=Rhodoluna limnophila TaxID=232537 RepID=UPI001106FB64|nr:GNAT family N-acetyltransferase [Rhodoluna limnophila]
MNNVVLREVSSAEDAIKVAEFFRTVWQDGDDVAPFDLILAAVHVGAYCVIAEVDGHAVGASFGIRGSFNSENILHSHVTAATVSGVGFQIKQHQMEWATENSIDAITWTFDPLVRRNCYFNFVKLGAIAIEYLPNFYGSMTDSINLGDVSDRLFAYWSVKTKSTESSLASPRNAGPEEVVVAIPEDIETMRSVDLESALKVRMLVRDQMLDLMNTGWQVTAMTPDRTSLILSKTE